MKFIKGFIKKNFLLAFTVLVLVGCYQANYKKNIKLVDGYKLETIEYQGCEYIVMQSHWEQHGTIIHKGNCKFCKERRQKEQKELIIKLKEK